MLALLLLVSGCDDPGSEAPGDSADHVEAVAVADNVRSSDAEPDASGQEVVSTCAVDAEGPPGIAVWEGLESKDAMDLDGPPMLAVWHTHVGGNAVQVAMRANGRAWAPPPVPLSAFGVPAHVAAPAWTELDAEPGRLVPVQATVKILGKGAPLEIVSPLVFVEKTEAGLRAFTEAGARARMQALVPADDPVHDDPLGSGSVLAGTSPAVEVLDTTQEAPGQ